MLDKAPPGPIETKWGIGFRSYSECQEYIRANNIEAPEGEASGSKDFPIFPLRR